MLDYAHDHTWASVTGRSSSTQFTLNCYERDIGVWGNCSYLLKAENSTCPWWEGDLFSCALRRSQWVQRFFHSFACQAEGCFEGRGKLCPWPQRGAINRNSKEAQGLQGLAVPQQPFPSTHHRFRHELRTVTSCNRTPPFVGTCISACPWREDFPHIFSGVSGPQSWEPLLLKLVLSHSAWFSDYSVSTNSLSATWLHLPSMAVTW